VKSVDRINTVARPERNAVYKNNDIQFQYLCYNHLVRREEIPITSEKEGVINENWR
jgi:hypothetical protein